MCYNFFQIHEISIKGKIVKNEAKLNDSNKQIKKQI